ncbi:putative cardiolipin synthase YwiE [Stieleria maiorica]|uniref:Putative cardiolipin synthase YwiE n=1 Tax=Stieleria maiorica TaxID=2795974 RepID=A0A5B9MH99_9BACT|nr:phospholipase D-like domain-containing protein [Stieleria maiorica]QEF98945.1 putative cardiolipin synthase YwiE [Stieleria maiorica]
MIWIVAYLSSVAGAFLSIVAMTIIRNEQRHSIGRIGWLGLILLSPPIGLILCLWLGGRKISREHEKRDLVDLPSIPGAECDLRDVVERMLSARKLGPPTTGNKVRLLSRPAEVRDAFMELIDGARETIHVMTFILDEKDTGRAVVDRLCKKARDGVEVRLLVDGFGSFALAEEQLEALRAAGGRAARFKRMSRLTRLAYLNFRNHRKLAVADGKRAILGGANIVEDEITSSPDDDTWVDLSLLIEGPAASQLQSVFCSDWTFQTGEELSQCEYEQGPACDEANPSRLTVMPIGPDGPEEILDDFWQFAIHHATERLWICTPYFVPPPNAMRSLELACRRGIDVRVLVPQVSDLRPVDYARFDYFKDLIELGCKVHRYPDRMVHAKIGIVDDLVALVGSANFDVRSFFLNYELSVLVHDRETIQRVSDWYTGLADGCERGTTDRSSVRSTLATAVRLFASEL